MENLVLAKKMNRAAWVITIAVLGLVFMMRAPFVEEMKKGLDVDFSFLPPIYSAMNALAALVLIAALYFIKKKNVEAHRKSIMVAFGLSTLFLLTYVLYHFTMPETPYQGEGTIRYVYFFLLASHVILAAVSFPFILFTFIRAYTGQIAKHRKMAKWVYPIWLYVAITGPIVYLMLYQF